MRIYISADMEGIAGVTSWEQIEEGGVEYSRFKKLMTAEINAAVSSAYDAGASAVVVNDAHGKMKNIVIEQLDPRVHLISGSPKRLGMMEGINKDYSAACFLGYHARAGSKGLLAHTFSDIVFNLSINDKPMGEFGVNALLAGYFGVPVIFVSGDDVLASEVKQLISKTETVVVKEAINYYSARSIAPKTARDKIREGIRKGLTELSNCLTPPSPATVKIQFINPSYASAAALFPGSILLNAVTLAYTGRDILEAYLATRCLLALAKNF